MEIVQSASRTARETLGLEPRTTQDETSRSRGGSPESMRGTCLCQRTTRTPAPSTVRVFAASSRHGALSTSRLRRGGTARGVGSGAGAATEITGVERTSACPASCAGASDALGERGASCARAEPRGNASVSATSHVAANSQAQARFMPKSRRERTRQFRRWRGRAQPGRSRVTSSERARASHP